MSDLTLTSGDASAVIATSDGARVASWRVAGLDLVGRGSESPHGWGAFPMAPWAGRVRHGELGWDGQTHQLPVNKPPHAIHGLVATQEWTVVDAGAAHAGLTCDLGAGWPWSGHVELRYALAEDSLTTTMTVHADAASMPVWCGVHPWFPRTLTGADGRTAAVTIDLRARGMLVRDHEDVATDREVPVPPGAPDDPRVDDCFTGVRWPVTLTWPGLVALEISSNATYAVVFTERDQAVAVEPQTAPPDAAALGLAPTASPGSPHAFTMTWTVTSP